MSPTRRSVLKAAALGGAASLASCERVTSLFTQRVSQRLPDSLAVCDGAEIDPDFHLLSRAAFGPWPGDVERLKLMGREEWIEEQLDPAGIKDSICDLRAGGFESLMMQAGNAYEFDKNVLRDQISGHALLRAIYSKRQLFEVMVEFWTDHLNIDLEKGDCVYLKPSDDRDVVRKHALGNFRDLIMASSKSPAMLTYLDGRDNKVRRKSGDKPNENYARELMELHTLGVHGGYTQDDVSGAAHCLAGWTVDGKATMLASLNPFNPALGQTYFRKEWHDDGEKKVLDQVIAAGGGERDIERLVEIVCAHASTANFISTKLCRRFASYDPPETLVNRVAEEFTRTGGDIKSLLRVILKSDEFLASRGQLLKRPFRFVVSALRALGADARAHGPLMETLHRMGQGLFQYPTPDGYPDAESPWLGTLLWRWNFAFALAGGRAPTVDSDVRSLAMSLDPESTLGGQGAPASVAKLVAHFTGRKAGAVELEAIGRGSDNAERVGLILASPAFQRC